MDRTPRSLIRDVQGDLSEINTSSILPDVSLQDLSQNGSMDSSNLDNSLHLSGNAHKTYSNSILEKTPRTLVENAIHFLSPVRALPPVINAHDRKPALGVSPSQDDLSVINSSFYQSGQASVHDSYLGLSDLSTSIQSSVSPADTSFMGGRGYQSILDTSISSQLSSSRLSQDDSRFSTTTAAAAGSGSTVATMSGSAITNAEAGTTTSSSAESSSKLNQLREQLEILQKERLEREGFPPDASPLNMSSVADDISSILHEKSLHDSSSHISDGSSRERSIQGTNVSSLSTHSQDEQRDLIAESSSRNSTVVGGEDSSLLERLSSPNSKPLLHGQVMMRGSLAESDLEGPSTLAHTSHLDESSTATLNTQLLSKQSRSVGSTTTDFIMKGGDVVEPSQMVSGFVDETRLNEMVNGSLTIEQSGIVSRSVGVAESSVAALRWMDTYPASMRSKLATTTTATTTAMTGTEDTGVSTEDMYDISGIATDNRSLNPSLIRVDTGVETDSSTIIPSQKRSFGDMVESSQNVSVRSGLVTRSTGSAGSGANSLLGIRRSSDRMSDEDSSIQPSSSRERTIVSDERSSSVSHRESGEAKDLYIGHSLVESEHEHSRSGMGDDGLIADMSIIEPKDMSMLLEKTNLQQQQQQQQQQLPIVKPLQVGYPKIPIVTRLQQEMQQEMPPPPRRLGQVARERSLLRMVSSNQPRKEKKTMIDATCIPIPLVKRLMSSFSNTRVSADSFNTINSINWEFFDMISDRLYSYARHRNGDTVEVKDVELLLKRQRLINEGTSFSDLVLDYMNAEQKESLL